MPIYILVIDYILRNNNVDSYWKICNEYFSKEDSEFFFMRVFVKYTNPIIKLFKFITPSFIIGPLVPLYVAWFFYMFRFYLMPYLTGIFSDGYAYRFH